MEAVIEIWPLRVGDQILLARLIALIVLVLMVYEISILIGSGMATKDIVLNFFGLKKPSFFKGNRVRNGLVLITILLVLVLLFDILVHDLQLEEVVEFSISV